MRPLPAIAIVVLFSLAAYGCKDVERSEVEVLRQQGDWPTLCVANTPKGRTLESIIQDLKGQTKRYPFQAELSYLDYGVVGRPAPRVSLNSKTRPFWDMLGALAVDSKTGFSIFSSDGLETWTILFMPKWEMFPGYEASGRYIVSWAMDMMGDDTSATGSIGLGSVSNNDFVVMVGFHPHQVELLCPPRITWTSNGRTKTSDCGYLHGHPVNIYPVPGGPFKQDDPVSDIKASVLFRILEDVKYIDIPVKAGSHTSRVGDLRCEFTCEGLAADERTQITIRFLSDRDITKEDESLYRRACELGTDTWEGASLLEEVSKRSVRYDISHIVGLGGGRQISPIARWYTHGINEYKCGITFEADTTKISKVRITMGRVTVKRVDCRLIR